MVECVRNFAEFDFASGQPKYKIAEVCELSQLQAEEILAAGLAEEEDTIDVQEPFAGTLQGGTRKISNGSPSPFSSNSKIENGDRRSKLRSI